MEEAVRPAFDCMTLGATRRFARSLRPGKAERLAVAYEGFPPRRSPLCLSDSGCAVTGPPSGSASIPAARVSSQPDRMLSYGHVLFSFKGQAAEGQNYLWILSAPHALMENKAGPGSRPG